MEDITFCRIDKRVNRFVVRIFVGGDPEYAVINNTGRLSQYLIKGLVGVCLKNKGRYKYRLIGVLEDNDAVLLDTNLQEKAFEILVKDGKIPWLKGYDIVKRNVRIGNSRIDFLLEGDGKKVLLEMKSAVFRNGNLALYPDTRSKRAERQVRDMLSFDGRRIILFVSAIPDVEGFRFNNLRAEELHRFLTENRDLFELRSIGLKIDIDKNAVVMYNDDLDVSLRPFEFKYLDIIEDAIKEYNSVRAPESIAQLWGFNGNEFKVRFTGHFCYTCGFYDYFDDFLFILEDMEYKFYRKEILEIENGAIVTFSKPPRSSQISQG